MDPDPAPDFALFVSDFQDANKKYFFFAYYFLKVHLHHSSKMKSLKKSQNSRNKYFSYYFSWFLLDAGRFWNREAQKQTDTLNPDPEHWFSVLYRTEHSHSAIYRGLYFGRKRIFIPPPPLGNLYFSPKKQRDFRATLPTAK
jgi:hypothetical protein